MSTAMFALSVVVGILCAGVCALIAWKDQIERRTGILWGLYRWVSGPFFHMAIGQSNRNSTFLEIGVRGRTFYAARLPR